MKLLMNKWRLACNLVLLPWTMYLLSNLKAFIVSLWKEWIHQSTSQPISHLVSQSVSQSLASPQPFLHIQLVDLQSWWWLECALEVKAEPETVSPTGVYRPYLAFKEYLWMGKFCCGSLSFCFVSRSSILKKMPNSCKGFAPVTPNSL